MYEVKLESDGNSYKLGSVIAGTHRINLLKGEISMVNELMDMHNHTILSDGCNTPEEIIENAIENGVTKVGISDHYNTIKCYSVSEKGLDKYIRHLELLKKNHKDDIDVLTGIEICTNREWCDLERLPIDKLNQLDYILLEYVDLFSDSITFKEIDKYVSKFKCRVGLAHTNLFETCRKYGLDFVADVLQKNNLLWEINVNPGYEYFDYIMDELENNEVRNLFQKLKEKNVEIIVGSDTHSLIYYDVGRLKKGNRLAKYIL